MNLPKSGANMTNRGPGSRLFLAGFLILAGTLLFLGNLGILPVRNIWAYWPLVVVALGLTRIMNGPDLVVRLFGGLVVLIGSTFLLVNLGVIQIRNHDRSWPISILLIVLGITMLIRVLDKSDPTLLKWTGFRPLRTGDAASGLTDFTVMGTVKRRIDNADFKGGNSMVILGSIELDLRRIRMAEPGQTIYLEVSSMLGSAKIRVPENWRVQIHGASILGTYEDKTVPPNVGADAPTLVITGYSFMSTIEIED
jgi:predicted membrane protein